MDNISIRKTYDETYSIKYDRWVSIYKQYFLMNVFLCALNIVFFFFRVHDSLGFIIGYTFFSMLIFHILCMVFMAIFWYDFTRCKNGEAMYLKEYYPDIWEKINPYGHIIIVSELRKYESGIYIKKNTDPIIDKIRTEKRNRELLAPLPFLSIIVFILIGFIIEGHR